MNIICYLYVIFRCYFSHCFNRYLSFILFFFGWPNIFFSQISLFFTCFSYSQNFVIFITHYACIFNFIIFNCAAFFACYNFKIKMRIEYQFLIFNKCFTFFQINCFFFGGCNLFFGHFFLISGSYSESEDAKDCERFSF